MLAFGVVTLFPALVEALAGGGITARAMDSGLVSVRCWNPRDFTRDRHRRVDDRPYGGGPGMVLKYEPTAKAIREAKQALPEGSPVICLSPQGKVFDQDLFNMPNVQQTSRPIPLTPRTISRM